MKLSSMTGTAGEWLRGEGPHHQIVISSRVDSPAICAPPVSGLGKEGGTRFDPDLIRPRVEICPKCRIHFPKPAGSSALDRQFLSSAI